MLTHIKKENIQDKKILLGTIKILDQNIVPHIASDQLGRVLQFVANHNNLNNPNKILLTDKSNSTNTITGEIRIDLGNGSEGKTINR